LLVITMLILSTAAPILGADADEITIKGGSAVVTTVEEINKLGIVDITGTHGFELQMGLDLNNTVGPWILCPCAPGDVWPTAGLRQAFFFDSDGSGTVTVDGNVFPLPSNQATVAFVLTTAGSQILPPISARAVITAPFEVERSVLSLFDFGGEPGVSFSLAGRGLATVELVPNPNAPLWEFSRVRYDFAATPEPGTLWLFGSAIAAMVVWRRRHSYS